jgi:hypothetical protein
MRRAIAVLSTAAVLMLAVGVMARATDFTGKWAPDADKNPAPAAGGGGGGGRAGGGGGGAMTVTQDAKTLTVVRSMGGNDVSTVYKLDGTDSTNTPPGRGGAAGTPQVSNATWDGANLKIVTKGANGDTTAIWSMEGGDLKISTTRPGRNGGDPTTAAVFYKKGM